MSTCGTPESALDDTNSHLRDDYEIMSKGEKQERRYNEWSDILAELEEAYGTYDFLVEALELCKREESAQQFCRDSVVKAYSSFETIDEAGLRESAIKYSAEATEARLLKEIKLRN